MSHCSANHILSNFNDMSIKQISNNFLEELKFDEEIDSWPLMKTPWPILSILAVYWLFVVKVGPKWMEKRKPFNLKYIMMIYNLSQLLFNGYMLWRVYKPDVINSLWKHRCSLDEEDHSEKRFVYITANEIVWLYIMNKISDLLDTVFFVLRKKESHVTFLHLFHHMDMSFSMWIYLRIIKASLGPKMQKYLWWKIYLTRLQIAQFVFVIIYLGSLYTVDCSFPKIFTIYMITHIALFLYMFIIFYKKTYQKTKSE
ncbi:elongation of very long chain fatty acids protein 4-like isoform X2 [Daktulosphaira vitifoliae]|uniref:elongation of very long chain fatty acids protein 4-like isoform X2 n=1 Tax=Daktulosphaira vitifoliae TaxID=58002 RepID=UPI0021AA0E48|nr:elongation of very long chain fatty acids protein 4-like isoform X2 [Daktulosphaira vitifoliae]